MTDDMRKTADKTTADAVISAYADRILGNGPVTMLVVLTQDRVIGWCQWYGWSDLPSEALAMKAREGEVGIDYALGDPTSLGRGLGTELIQALVVEVRRAAGDVGLLVGVDATNVPSRRALESSGFALVAVRPVATEPRDEPVALYRLGP